MNALVFLVAAYLLWSERHRLLECVPSKWRFGVLVGVIVGVTSLVGYGIQSIPSSWTTPNNTAQSNPTTIVVNCDFSMLKQPQSAVSCKMPIADEKELSGKLELTLAALGIFITLVTSISLTVAKNATDEARRAEEQVQALHQKAEGQAQALFQGTEEQVKALLQEADEQAQALFQGTEEQVKALLQGTEEQVKALRQEVDYVSQAKRLAVRQLFTMSLIQTIAQLARTSLLEMQFKINPAPLLDQKIQVLENLLRWETPEFDVDALHKAVETLCKYHNDNLTYQLHWDKFFNQYDQQACEGLLVILSQPVQGAYPLGYPEAAQAVRQLLRTLK